MPSSTSKSVLQQHLRQVRRDAALASMVRLLNDGGLEQATMDQIASEAGMTKPSLYKLFKSKDELAVAVMTRALDEALSLTRTLRPSTAATAPEQTRSALQALARWAIQSRLENKHPALVPQDARLLAAVQQDPSYLDLLVSLCVQLSTWVREAQHIELLDKRMPAELMVYSILASATHPMLGAKEKHAPGHPHQKTDWLVTALFQGLGSASAAA